MSQDKNYLLVLTNDQEQYREELRNRDLPGLHIEIPSNEAEIAQHLDKANLLLANPPIARKYINKLPRLEWMQSTYAGIDAMIDSSLRDDYLLTNVKGVYGSAMAEFVMAYVLLYEKEVLENLQHQDATHWAERPYSTLKGVAMGIMGTGSVGATIARAAKCFGMSTLGYRSLRGAVNGFDAIYTEDNLDEFLAHTDYLVIALPRTSETDNLIDRQKLECMSKNAVLINVGRGHTVVESDLVHAVSNGDLRGAVLDVFRKEPLKADSRLWTTPGIVVTPHVSGYIVSDEIFDIFQDNYRKFTSGSPLQYQVSFSKGY